jgi:hypothetical protein
VARATQALLDVTQHGLVLLELLTVFAAQLAAQCGEIFVDEIEHTLLERTLTLNTQRIGAQVGEQALEYARGITLGRQRLT